MGSLIASMPDSAKSDGTPADKDAALNDLTDIQSFLRPGAESAIQVSLLEGAAEFTDAAHAKRLIDLHGEHVRYIPPWNAWIVWDGLRWQRDLGGIHVAELAKSVGLNLLRESVAPAQQTGRARELAIAGQKALAVGRIGAMVALARGISGVPVSVEQLDKHPWLLGVRNGVVDLKTGELRAADPRNLMTLQAAVPFEADALCPRWDRALGEWFPDADVRGYVHRLTGAMLVGQQLDHLFVIHYGGGRNGKGTFTRALERVLGGEYSTTPSLSLLVQTTHAEHPTVIAQLRGARLAVAAETERRAVLSEAQVKTLTGADRLVARGMHENPWTFEPSHSLWLQTNHLPKIRGRDRGIWSRVKVVEWVASFTGTKDDRGLGDALAEEGPGILAWAVRGCLEWQLQGLNEPDGVKRATLAYQRREDVVERFVTEIGLEFGKGEAYEVPKTTITEKFRAWLEANDVRGVNGADINAFLEEKGARIANVRREGRKQWMWLDARIVEQV